MIHSSDINTFTSKGNISLIGNAELMFCNATSFASDLSRWNVEKL